MNQYTYLIINMACIIVPLIASFYPKHSFFREWKYFIPANILVAIFFIFWDYHFTEMGIWGFNPQYLTGIYMFNLPIEEVLFFFCIPYACVFTFYAFQYLIKKNPLIRFEKIITYLLIIILLSSGVFFIGKTYTSLTFFLTSFFLLYTLIKKIDLSMIYLSYLAVFPFFLLSNGILTGSFLSNPIVWYNDSENIGIKLLTIPLEDSIYGFLLIILNIHIYTSFKKISTHPVYINTKSYFRR